MPSNQPHLTRAITETDEGIRADEHCDNFRLLPVGETLGRYVIREHLGSGGSSEVYAAFDYALHRVIALKVLHNNTSHLGSATQKRLLSEAQAMARLSHPHVVTVFDIGNYEGWHFIAMERIVGMSLSTWLSRRRRPWSQVLGRFVEAGQGLQAIHEVGLVHRDFKPHNVLIDEADRSRVTDFGLASLKTDGFANTGGTPAYMSPEQINSGIVDARSDQYSFCAALYEGLYGLKSKPGGPTTREPPSWLRRIIERGLSLEKEHRFASMAALLEEIARGVSLRRKVHVASILAATATLAASSSYAVMHRAPLCVPASERVALQWNDSTRDSLHAALFTSKSPYPLHVANQLVAQVEDAFAQWAVAYDSSCAEAADTGVMDSRVVECLDDGLFELGKSVELLTRADHRLLMRAAEFVPAISSPNDCTLKSQSRQHQDAQTSVSLRQELIKSTLLMKSGSLHEGEQLAQSLTNEVNAVGDQHLQAAHRHALGIAASLQGRQEEAATWLREAVRLALASGDDNRVWKVWVALAQVHARLEHFEEARTTLELASAMASQFGSATTTAESLATTRGFVEMLAHQPAAAKSAFEDALKFSNATKEPLGVSRIYSNLSAIEVHLGNPDAASVLAQQAVELLTAAVGTQHPLVADAQNNLGAALLMQHKAREALPHLVNALEVRQSTLPAGHHRLLSSQFNTAEALLETGDPHRAIELLETAIEYTLKSKGELPEDFAEHEARLALAFARIGKYLKAEQLSQQALKRTTPSATRHLVLLLTGQTAREMGQFSLATTRLLSSMRDVPTSGSYRKSLALVALTEVAEARGQQGRALEWATQAVSAANKSSPFVPSELAYAQQALSRLTSREERTK